MNIKSHVYQDHLSLITCAFEDRKQTTNSHRYIYEYVCVYLSLSIVLLVFVLMTIYWALSFAHHCVKCSLWIISFKVPSSPEGWVSLSPLSLMSEEWSTLFNISNLEYDKDQIKAHIPYNECVGLYRTGDIRLLKFTPKLSKAGTNRDGHVE